MRHGCRILWLLLGLLLASCASQPLQLAADCAGELPASDPFYRFIDRQQTLAVNRYLVSRVAEPGPHGAWLAWSSQMANEARLAQGLSACAPPAWSLTSRQAEQVIEQAPDEYSTLLRALGLYPLTRWPFVAGVKTELAHTAARYADFAGVGLAGGWRIWGSQDQPRLATDSPLIEPAFRQALRDGVAVDWMPYFAVQQGQPGANSVVAVGRSQQGELLVDPESPLLYWYAGFGTFAGQQTLQLNYQVWFSERPAKSAMDPLAGKLDGLHWRVHLDRQLKPIAFDAMHTCGCWYQIFPAPGYAIRPAEDAWQEPVFGGPVQYQARPMLLLAADTHALVGIRPAADAQGVQNLPAVLISPAAAASDAPLSAPAISYRRVFDGRGRVVESARAERWYFWPMGVPDAGSMRAPGHHAIAFTGRRHFDDPGLLDELAVQKPD